MIPLHSQIRFHPFKIMRRGKGLFEAKHQCLASIVPFCLKGHNVLKKEIKLIGNYANLESEFSPCPVVQDWVESGENVYCAVHSESLLVVLRLSLSLVRILFFPALRIPDVCLLGSGSVWRISCRKAASRNQMAKAEVFS